MIYFTSELLDRFGSLDDSVADLANVEWEEKSQEYREHLDAIRGHLPADLKNLLQDYLLHDAEVYDINCGCGLLFIKLKPETAPHSLLLTYELSEAPAVLDGNQNTRLPLDAWLGQRRARYWLYDEIAIYDREAPWIFSHTILFSDGTELSLKFKTFRLDTVPATPTAHQQSSPNLNENGLHITVRAGEN